MAFSDGAFPSNEQCEICGAELGDEIVIQEFADGSYARVCPECAAGALFDVDEDAVREPFVRNAPGNPTPEAPEQIGTAETGDVDPLEKTRELLTPVADLISLQGEMQAALERLAASLERFAAEVISDSLDKTAIVESRLRTLEKELEKTRADLREAESLLVSAGGVPAGSTGAIAAPSEGPPPVFAGGSSIPAPSSAIEATAAALGDTSSSNPPQYGPVTESAPEGPFRLEEVQWTQRYFNDSPFTARLRDVHRSLGKPRANLSRVTGPEPRVLVTVLWDIVWYQYLVDLRREIPSEDHVTLFREGMKLDDLAECFKEKNASIDDEGRLDASELEVRLLSDPTVLITEMTPDQEQALEDATEEIWDQHAAPEFKWDD